MSEVGAPGAGAPASAPAETSVPLPDSSQGRLPNPASTPTLSQDEVSQGQPPSGKERRSIGDSLDKTLEAAKTEPKAEAKAKPEPKAEPKAPAKADAKPAARETEPANPSPRERGDDGRFASTQPREEPAAASGTTAQSAHHQPLHRFSAEAKADWDKTPETVKAETHRMHREMEAGLHKYRGDAEAYNEVRDIAEYAKQTGRTFREWGDSVRRIESDLFSSDVERKAKAIDYVIGLAGATPEQYVAHKTNQPMPPPAQAQAEINQRFQAYEHKIAEQARELHAIRTKITESEVKGFAREYPRFDELSLTVASYLNGQNDRGIHIDPQRRLPEGERLQQAYQLAEELNPSARTSASFNPEPRPANGAGTKSIAGSPANGSNPSLPAHRKGQRPSVKDSVDRARARLGP